MNCIFQIKHKAIEYKLLSNRNTAAGQCVRVSFVIERVATTLLHKRIKVTVIHSAHFLQEMSEKSCLPH